MGYRIGSLFSGIGGLDLGVEVATRGRVVWQCERDAFCRSRLVLRWPGVPCLHDVKAIQSENLQPVDILVGGFPCQDISQAGKRAGITGERSGLWSHFARIIRDLRPPIVFVENVAALVHRGLDVVLGDLAACGYDAEWDVLGACCVGAPHRRERLFILAAIPDRVETLGAWDDSDACRDSAKRPMADPDRGGCEIVGVSQPGGQQGARGGEPDRCRSRRREYEPAGSKQWSRTPESGICRVVDGAPDRVDRLRCLGNAVVPQQATAAWRILRDRLLK